MIAFEIVDLHVHLQRDVEMERIMYPRPGWPDDWFWFTPERVTQYMDFWNFSSIVSVNLMNERRVPFERARIRGLPPTEPVAEPLTDEEFRSLVRDLNEWGLDVGAEHPRILQFMATEPVAFGSRLVHDVEDWVRRGAKGLKVHPRVGRHLPSHPDMLPVYDLCQQLGIPILADTGGEPIGGRPPLTHPRHWTSVLRDFPRLKLVMAHFGGELWEDRVEIGSEFRSENVVFDLAGGLVDESHPPRGHRQLPAADAPRVFRAVGVDRILYGSDAPHGDPMDTARQVAGLELTDSEKQQIFAGNAKRILGI